MTRTRDSLSRIREKNEARALICGDAVVNLPTAIDASPRINTAFGDLLGIWAL